MGFGHWPDVVEDDPRHRAGPHGCEQYRQDAAPRGADEHRAVNLERGEHRDEIRNLDSERIIGRLAVVVRAAAAAAIGGDDAPGLGTRSDWGARRRTEPPTFSRRMGSWRGLFISGVLCPGQDGDCRLTIFGRAEDGRRGHPRS
jgi:hypothetical protein